MDSAYENKCLHVSLEEEEIYSGGEVFFFPASTSCIIFYRLLYSIYCVSRYIMKD